MTELELQSPTEATEEQTFRQALADALTADLDPDSAGVVDKSLTGFNALLPIFADWLGEHGRVEEVLARCRWSAVRTGEPLLVVCHLPELLTWDVGTKHLRQLQERGNAAPLLCWEPRTLKLLPLWKRTPGGNIHYPPLASFRFSWWKRRLMRRLDTDVTESGFAALVKAAVRPGLFAERRRR